ncbi:MAG TPA: DNA translocase FtsK 4TM domain-containing protein, partial [Sphingomonas sp.]|nr:DNA translocase FtsK 4TM domain-containing protein [Sphingomonas sp.]
MATRIAGTGNWRGQIRHIGRRGWAMLSALAVLAFAMMLAFALVSYSPTDPAMMTAAGGPVRNVLGPAGAWGADLALTLFGLPSILLVPPLVVVALRLWRGVHPGAWKRALPITIVAMLLCDVAIALVRLGLSGSLPAGAGGAIGLGAANAIDGGLALLQPGWAIAIRIAAVLVLGILGVTMALWSLGLDAEER